MTADIRVRLFAGARAAANGLDELTLECADLAGLRHRLCSDYGPTMARVLASCSFLVDGVAVGRDETRSLAGARTIDVLPPFAGG